MWARATLLVGLLGAAMPAGVQQTPSEARALTRSLPAALPDLSGWERSSGHAEFDDPHRVFDYELYVDPSRNATYAVTRYRIRVFDSVERLRSGITDTEKLQWDIDGRVLRRFECRPQPAHPEGCSWVELATGSEGFRQQLMPILAVYSVHRQLLAQREQSQGAPR